MYNFPIKIKKIIWFLRSILNFSIQQNLSGVRDKYESVDISDICVLLRFLWWVIFCFARIWWYEAYEAYDIRYFWYLFIAKGQSFLVGYFAKERSRQSCRLFGEFLQQNHPNKSETSCFRESCCFSSFFCNKVMQQINYPRNSILSKYWHCNASCFNYVNRVSIIAIWRDLKWEWWSWFCW